MEEDEGKPEDRPDAFGVVSGPGVRAKPTGMLGITGLRPVGASFPPARPFAISFPLSAAPPCSLDVKGNIMHIEPGYLADAKIAAANVAAIGLLASQCGRLAKTPQAIARTLLAAVFFTLLMQAFHLPAGPSELHFVGALPIYLRLGFAPTLFGFALGLLLQGMLFAPADLVHLSVNTLSLALPLCLLHAAAGKRPSDPDLGTILRLDAVYYGGVTLMVGFWLTIGEAATPFAAWAAFAASYGSVAIAEPISTWGIVRGLARLRNGAALRVGIKRHAA